MKRRAAAPIAIAALAALAAPALAADWAPPKDGVLTEKQIDTWLDYTKKIVALARARLKEIDELSKQTAGAERLIATQKRFDDETAKILAASGLSKEEMDWVGKTTTDTYATLQGVRSARENLESAMKPLEDAVVAARKARDEVAEAKKSGRRILTPEDKTAAKEQAQGELKEAEGALADARQKVADATKALGDAQAALKAADADGKEAAQAALDGAQKDLADAQATQKEAAANVERAKRKAADPDLPQTDDEKQALKAELAEREKSTQEELERATKARDQARAQSESLLGDVNKTLAALPAKNRALVEARFEKIETAFHQALDPTWEPGKK